MKHFDGNICLFVFWKYIDRNMYIFGIFNKASSEPFGLEKVACTRPRAKTKPHRSHQNQSQPPKSPHLRPPTSLILSHQKSRPQPPKVQAPTHQIFGLKPKKFISELSKVQS